MKFTEGGFRDWGYDLAQREFGGEPIDGGPWLRIKNPKTGNEIVVKDSIADAFLQQILLRPAEYSVIATLNLNGDYVSDALAAQVGGIGIAPGANMSDTVAMFEATHGTAPKYAGKDYVNPGSEILSAEMMLRHMGWGEAADLIISSMEKSIQSKKVTYDFARLMAGRRAGLVLGLRAGDDRQHVSSRGRLRASAARVFQAPARRRPGPSHVRGARPPARGPAGRGRCAAPHPGPIPIAVRVPARDIAPVRRHAAADPAATRKAPEHDPPPALAPRPGAVRRRRRLRAAAARRPRPARADGRRPTTRSSPGTMPAGVVLGRRGATASRSSTSAPTRWRRASSASLPLANTIAGPPTNLAITPDQGLALVANSLNVVEEGGVRKQVPDDRLWVIDLDVEPAAAARHRRRRPPAVGHRRSTAPARWRWSPTAPTTRSACCASRARR